MWMRRKADLALGGLTRLHRRASVSSGVSSAASIQEQRSRGDGEKRQDLDKGQEEMVLCHDARADSWARDKTSFVRLPY